MSGQVSVTGGAGGTTAAVEDILAMAGLLHSAAASISDVAAELGSSRMRNALAVGADRDPLGAAELAMRVGALGGPFGAIERLAGDLASLSGRLIFAALAYDHAEQGVLATVLGGLRDLTMGVLRIAGGDPVDGSQRMLDGLPGLADGLAVLTTPLTLLYAEAVPDGHAVLHDLGPDTRTAANQPPRSLADLMSGLAVRDGGHHGEISVSFLVGADGRRRAIVDIPGTKSWNPLPNRDITSVGTDIRAMAGLGTSYEDGVFAAMRAAGVTRDDEVMLVGHSEGGIVAVNAARDAARTGRFDITHIVTAAAPIGRLVGGLPERVQVLALENSDDIVPAADGAANPDLPNVTTVTVHQQHGGIVADHTLDTSYVPAAAAADATPNASIEDFVASAHGFLDAPDPMHTHAYWITRDP